MTIGERIYYCRVENHMTQKELGEKAGIDPSTIRKYESGRLNPKIGTLRKIADALNCDIADLDESFAVSIEEIAAGLSGVERENEKTMKRIKSAYSKLNAEGRIKAAERVEELTEIKRFQQSTTLYDKTIQELKDTQNNEVVQKIIDHADDIVFQSDDNMAKK